MKLKKINITGEKTTPIYIDLDSIKLTDRGVQEADGYRIKDNNVFATFFLFVSKQEVATTYIEAYRLTTDPSVSFFAPSLKLNWRIDRVTAPLLLHSDYELTKQLLENYIKELSSAVETLVKILPGLNRQMQVTSSAVKNLAAAVQQPPDVIGSDAGKKDCPDLT